MGITLVYYFPAGFLYARAGSLVSGKFTIGKPMAMLTLELEQLATNLIAEIIPGYMLQGSILGNMVRRRRPSLP
jgi:hypothetical protein